MKEVWVLEDRSDAYVMGLTAVRANAGIMTVAVFTCV
jgi:hypothetical protein